jgi:hypothetical protein
MFRAADAARRACDCGNLPLMHLRCILLRCIAIGLLIAGCMQASSAQPASSPSPLFEFHSGLWINLHHFLYLAARARRGDSGRRTATMTEADISALTSLSAEDQQRWTKAVSYYSNSMVTHDLLFDRNMETIKNALEDAESSPDLSGVTIPEELRAVLVSVAPVYRKYLWPRHDEQNRRWIDAVKPLAATYGAGLRDALVKIYDEPWPGQPVRVDVSVYGGDFGAYTTIEPTRVTISSTDPGNQGKASLEVLFHETSHGMMEQVRSSIHEAEARLNPGKSQPQFRTGTMWHAVLFYTIGALLAETIRGYTPYAEANGLWSLAWPAPDHELIEQDWKPHMAGKVSLDEAIYNLARDWKAASRARQTPQ